jgi:hypothetical protein
MRKLLLVGMIILALSAIGSASAFSNGGFENPSISPGAFWSTFPDGTPGLVWNVEQGIGPGPTSPPGVPTLEFQNVSTLGLAPAEGLQYAELDSYANVNISQIVSLKAGTKYHISFAQTCRPAESGVSSILGVYLDGVLISRTTCDQTLQWKTHSVDVTPTSDTDAKLMFADEGILQQSYGVLLDDIVIEDEKNTVPIPEFPTMALPVGAIIGILGAVFYIRSTREL